MTYEELVNIIKEKIECYKKVEDSEEGFFVDFLEKYPKNEFNYWVELKNSDLFKAICYMNDIEINIDDEILGLADVINETGFLDLTALATNNFNDRRKILNKLLMQASLKENDNGHKFSAITKSLVIHCETRYEYKDFDKFATFYASIIDHMDTMVITALTALRLEYERISALLKLPHSKKDKLIARDEKTGNSVTISNESDIKKFLEDTEKFPSVYDDLEKIYEYARKKVGNLDKKKINRMISMYTTLLDNLAKEKEKDEIVSVNKILDSNYDIDIYGACLKYIYSHNEAYYERLEKLYLDRSENSSIKFAYYFNSIGIDFNMISISLQNKIMEENLDIVKKKMNIIIKLSNSNFYLDILINNSLEELERIMDYVKRQYITSAFIIDNPNILTDKERYINFVRNIKLLLSYKVNLIKYEDKSFLLMANELLMNNIDLLEQANIPFSKTTDLSFLSTPLKEKIDKFVEVGLENIIYENPDILNCDEALAERIIITKMIGENPIENNKIKDFVLNKDKFFVSPGEVPKYLLDRNNSKYQNNMTIFIPNIESTNLSYNVDGVIIPKGRVLRQPVSLETIIKPSLYSSEEIKKLERSTKK